MRLHQGWQLIQCTGLKQLGMKFRSHHNRQLQFPTAHTATNVCLYSTPDVLEASRNLFVHRSSYVNVYIMTYMYVCVSIYW